MDILARDLFDSAPGTPENTSWVMAVLTKLDKALGPGAMYKPIFPLSSSTPKTPPHSDLIDQVLDGKFNSLFGEQTKISEIGTCKKCLVFSGVNVNRGIGAVNFPFRFRCPPEVTVITLMP